MPAALANGRGNIPKILMNGQAAAYSSRCRIREAEPYHRQKLVVKPNAGPKAGSRQRRLTLRPDVVRFETIITAGSRSAGASRLSVDSRGHRPAPGSIILTPFSCSRRSFSPAAHFSILPHDRYRFGARGPT